MTKLSTFLLVLVVLGMMGGLYISYRMIKAQRQVAHLKNLLAGSDQIVESMSNHLDQLYGFSMVFMHHSVGHGFLYSGGLQDSLLHLGIVVRSATYGDEIGQQTDICDWVGKFDQNLDQILSFRTHPNKYYEGNRSNDIVMFKSCFPNSGITGGGTGEVDPTSREKTIANFQSAFVRLKGRLASQKDKLFVYMTAPPLVPEETSPAEAARAKEFNQWLLKEYWPTYREDTGLDNFVVYDLFSFLSDDEGHLKQSYRPDWPHDSHPNADGNRAVAADFMGFFAPLWEHWRNTHLNPPDSGR